MQKSPGWRFASSGGFGKSFGKSDFGGILKSDFWTHFQFFSHRPPRRVAKRASVCYRAGKNYTFRFRITMTGIISSANSRSSLDISIATETTNKGSLLALMISCWQSGKIQLPTWPWPILWIPASLTTVTNDWAIRIASASQKNSGRTMRRSSEAFRSTLARIPTAAKTLVAIVKLISVAFFIALKRVCLAISLFVLSALFLADSLSERKKIDIGTDRAQITINRAWTVFMTNLSVSAGDTHGRFLAGLDLPIYPKPSKWSSTLASGGGPKPTVFKLYLTYIQVLILSTIIHPFANSVKFWPCSKAHWIV